MGRTLIERERALVNGIGFCNLRAMPDAARHGEIGIAAGIGENLHFGIDAAEVSASAVGQREISVHKSVRGTRRPFFHREAAMAKGQPVAVFGEQLASIFGGIGMLHSVMQVNLDFSPTSMAVLGEHLQQTLIILLSGIEVGVSQRTSVVVAPAVDGLGIFAHPPFQAAFLLGTRGRADNRPRERWPVRSDQPGQRSHARDRERANCRARQVDAGRTFLA